MSEEPLYDGRTREEWYRELGAQTEWMMRTGLLTFALLGLPSSLLDVGCGLGVIVHLAKALGVDAIGIDQLGGKDNKIIVHANLVEKYQSGYSFEMVWCTEVAEHLDASAHATLCDTLADNLQEGGKLVFSSAFPNQGGSSHLAERPARYWHDQFAMRNLNYRKDLTVNLALLWSNIGSPLYWLPAHVLIFEK